jgi:hypothetical protein
MQAQQNSPPLTKIKNEWDSPFTDSAAAPSDDAQPWENPFEQESGGFDSWNTPADSGSSSKASAYQSAPADDVWSGSAFDDGRAPAKRKKSQSSSGGSSDMLLNIAIAVVGILVLIGGGALLISRADINFSFGGGGAPNTFTGGDGFDTTGGGMLTINGDPAQDTLYNHFDAHNWAFEAQAGQQVIITVHGHSDCDPRVRLLDPQGVVVAEDDDSGNNWDAYLVYTPTQTGIYTARVDIFTGGRFSVSVTTP